MYLYVSTTGGCLCTVFSEALLKAFECITQICPSLAAFADVYFSRPWGTSEVKKKTLGISFILLPTANRVVL